MATTLCDYMDTLGMVVTLVKAFHEVLFNQPYVGQPHVMVVPPWHAIAVKFEKLLAHPPIDQVKVLLGVVVVRN
jgi:hypothetical protein